MNQIIKGLREGPWESRESYLSNNVIFNFKGTYLHNQIVGYWQQTKFCYMLGDPCYVIETEFYL